MASNLQRSWRSFDNIFVVRLSILLAMVRSSYAGFQATDWTYAHATFYGDDTAAETMGGACGYGNLFNSGYGTNTAALSTVLFNNGNGCGSCYQLKCVESRLCVDGGYGGQPTITVTATNLCPPNWYQSSDDGGWCNPPRQHFDLAKPAFNQLAITEGGIVPVMYRRVPCPTKGGIRFSFQGNAYWLLVTVMNVGGSGDISQMWVKGSNTGWLSMTHNWGASYQAFAQLGGQPLSFRIQSYTTSDTIVAYNVAPQYWSLGLSYEADVNFH